MFKEPDVETCGLLHTAKGMTESVMHFSIILFFQPSYIHVSSFGLMIKILRAFNTVSINTSQTTYRAAAKLVLKKCLFVVFLPKKTIRKTTPSEFGK